MEGLLCRIDPMTPSTAEPSSSEQSKTLPESLTSVQHKESSETSIDTSNFMDTGEEYDMLPPFFFFFFFFLCV